MTTIKVCWICETVTEIIHKSVSRKISRPYEDLMDVIGEWISEEIQIVCDECQGKEPK